MQVKLRVMLGAAAGQEIKVPVAKFLIGRGEECHLRPRSEAISRQHCALVIEETKVVVRDLQSRNGTLVNGKPVDGVQALQAGDRLQVGPLVFEVMIDHPLGGAKRPVVRDVKEVAQRTANASSEDLDIAEWLDTGEPDDSATDASAPETRQFHMHETLNVALETDIATEDTAQGGQSKDTARGEQSEEDLPEDDENSRTTVEVGATKLKKDAPGKLPPAPKLSAVDSREAAADMLKRFFNRR